MRSLLVWPSWSLLSSAHDTFIYVTYTLYYYQHILILYVLKHSDICYCYFCLNNNRILNKINTLYKMKMVLKVFLIFIHISVLSAAFFPVDSGIHLKAFPFSKELLLVCLLAIQLSHLFSVLKCVYFAFIFKTFFLVEYGMPIFFF